MKKLDVDGMFAQSSVAMGVGVMKTTIEHKMARMGCSDSKELRKRTVSGYYSGILMYTNLFAKRTLREGTWKECCQ